MTKNEIIEEINAADFWIELNNKMGIKPNYYMRNWEDLKQNVMLHLLELKDDVLQNMYNTKTYKFYIIRIILNQRNGENTEYNRLRSTLDYTLVDYLYDDSYHNSSNLNKEKIEHKLNYIFKELNSKSGNDYNDVAKQLFSIYYERKYVKKDKLNYTKFAKELKISRNTLNDLLVKAKQLLREGYDATVNN